MNFRVLAHLDTWRLGASLHVRQGLLHETGTLLRVGRDWEPVVDEKWQALRNIVSRIERLEIPGDGLGDIRLVGVRPSTGSDWESGRGCNFLHLPIVTNPTVVVHSGLEARHIPAGLLTFVNGGPLCCVVNHGEFIAAHLVIESSNRSA